MEDDILRTALAPGGTCLSVEQLGRYADSTLSAQEQSAAEAHIRGCLSCQAELALLEAVTSGTARDGEADIIRDGAARLQPPSMELVRDRAEPSSRSQWYRVRRLRVAAVAAVFLLGIGAGSFYFVLTRRAHELPVSVTTSDEVTRSLAVRLRGPSGDVSEWPQRFEWLAVDGAARYRVRLMEVDRQEVWSTSSSALGVDVPASVRASIAPGRTLLWDVTAYDAAGTAIAESAAQSFRVLRK